MKAIEKGFGFKNLFRDFVSQVSMKSISAGVVASIFAFTAILFFYPTGAKLGLDVAIINTWLCNTITCAGIIGVLMAAYYRQPIVMASSFTGCVVFMIAAVTYSYSEALFGAVLSGVILVILGVSGLMKYVARFLPAPVVLGMIAGCFLPFGLNVVSPLVDHMVITALMILSYVLCQKYFRKVPAVIASIVIGGIYVLMSGVAFPAVELSFILPSFIAPAITDNFFNIFITLTIPLTVLVLGAENAQAYGVLMGQDYKAPINSMTFISGIGGIIAGLTGACNINVAGPMTAICSGSDAGEKDGRWTGAVVSGIIWIIVGPFYGSLAGFFMKFPSYYINIIAGLAILAVIVDGLRGAFTDATHRTSAVFAFLVAASGIKILKISAPFWSLVIGIIIYILVEDGLKKDTN